MRLWWSALTSTSCFVVCFACAFLLEYTCARVCVRACVCGSRFQVHVSARALVRASRVASVQLRLLAFRLRALAGFGHRGAAPVEQIPTSPNCCCWCERWGARAVEVRSIAACVRACAVYVYVVCFRAYTHGHNHVLSPVVIIAVLHLLLLVSALLLARC